VWISPNRHLVRELQSRGFASFYRWSLKGIRASVRAGLYVVNDNTSDVQFSLSGGARILNLWHGVGLKNVRYGAHVGFGAALQARARNPVWRVRNMRRFETPDWVLATSPEMARDFFARCFRVPVNRAPALGYPRLDVVLDAGLRKLAASFGDRRALEQPGTSKRILYVPTLRDSETDLLQRALPDLSKLAEALRAQDAEMFVKLHPKMAVRHSQGDGLPPNIRIIPADLDIYPDLHSFDALITDYSSLFFDFIYARPGGVVLYTYDFDRYRATERDLAWDYDEVTAGTRANDFAALCDAIEQGRVFDQLDPAKLARIRKRFWGGEPQLPTASEKIFEYMLAQQRIPN